MSYVIDACTVIDMHRTTPVDVYPTVWRNVEGLVGAALAVMPRLVLEELERFADYCGPWAKALDGFVVLPDEDELAVVAQIAVQHPDWVQEQHNAADPFLIANAVVHDRIVVTQERPKGPGTPDVNLKIPNVATEHGVTCVNFLELARREAWKI
jgi:hypothetical protein